MVQPSRLKRSPHPLTPIILIPLLLLLLIIFWFKMSQFYAIKVFQNYELERIDVLSEINLKLSEVSLTLNSNISKQSKIKILISDCQEKVTKILTMYDSIIVKETELAKNLFIQSRLSQIKDNITVDEQKRKEIYNLSIFLDTKILALNQYDLLVDVDRCIKKISDLKSKNMCLALLEETQNLSIFDPQLYLSYKKTVEKTIANYLNYSTETKKKKLNEIVKIHNLFTKILENSINEKYY